MVTELLATLRDLDVKIWAEGDQIRVSTPRGTLQPELRQKIKEFKPELLAILRVSQSASVAARTQIPRISRDEPLALSAIVATGAASVANSPTLRFKSVMTPE